MERLTRAVAWRAGRTAAVCTSVTGALAALASSAFACSASMGNLVISPTSGAAGTAVNTSASGMKSRATYAMHFGKTSTSNCMSFTGVITLGRVTASVTGTWSNVVFVVPSTATMGSHGFCGIEVSPVKGQTGTSHGVFTVT